MKLAFQIGLLMVLSLAAMAAVPQEPVAQLPDCMTWEGKPVQWDGVQGSPVIVLFYKEGKEYCHKGLSRVTERLKKHTDVSRKTALIVVQVGDVRPEQALAVLRESKFSYRIVRAQEKHNFGPLRAVAYPTAYVCDAALQVVHAVKGWGPSFAHQVHAGARLAVGELDQQQFEKVLAGEQLGKWSKRQRGILRTVEASYRSAAQGKLSRAQKLLSEAVAEFQAKGSEALPVDAMEAMVRLTLLQPQADSVAAQAWLDQLQQADPKHPRLALLRCRLELLNGRPEEAKKALSRLRNRGDLEIQYLEARILEAQGEQAKAVASYRDQLESCIVQGTVEKMGE
jgi:hypothetical protein